MEVFFATLVGFGIAYAIGNRLVSLNHKLRKIMVELDNLEANLVETDGKLTDLQIAVDRIVSAQDPAIPVRVGAAADAVKALGNALGELKNRIDVAVPPAPPVTP